MAALESGKRKGAEIGQVELVFSEQAWEDSFYLHKIGKKRVQRIDDLIKRITRTTHAGTGKPAPLNHALAGYWSRRINDEHQVVCKVVRGSLLIARLRYHY